MLWAGLRVAMWITKVGGKLRHGLLEKSLKIPRLRFTEEIPKIKETKGWRMSRHLPACMSLESGAKKHVKKFSIKNLGAPKPPPPTEILYVRPFPAF